MTAAAICVLAGPAGSASSREVQNAQGARSPETVVVEFYAVGADGAPIGNVKAEEVQLKIDGRARPPEGQVFVPFFDESMLINELTLDAFCPISGQPDYKKCAVKVERA